MVGRILVCSFCLIAFTVFILCFFGEYVSLSAILLVLMLFLFVNCLLCLRLCMLVCLENLLVKILDLG